MAAATLVETEGSSPLEAGATMLVDDAGRIEGSVTGGCVESALAEEAADVLSGAAPRVLTYGISDDQAISVGLMCGGTVQVFVHELGAASREAVMAAAAAIKEDRAVALATLLDGERAGTMVALVDDRLVGSFGMSELLDRSVQSASRGALHLGRSELRRYGSGGELMGDELRVYISALAAPPELVIVGAIDFSAALAGLAGQLGYRVTICDPRPPFLSSARFQIAHQVVVEWPDRYLQTIRLGPRDAVVVFTHDPKFDEPALRGALQTDAGYIGALGSRSTQADRLRRLSAAGVSAESLERIAAPCGLDIGARTPGETAVSVLAEIIMRASGRGGEPLANTSGPIHPRRDRNGRTPAS